MDVQPWGSFLREVASFKGFTRIFSYSICLTRLQQKKEVRLTRSCLQEGQHQRLPRPKEWVAVREWT